MTLEPPPTPPPPAPARRRLPPRRVLVAAAVVAAAVVAVVGIAGVEGLLRWRFGLGEPPLMTADPLTEYRYTPDHHYRRRGNVIDVNHYSMRSDAFPPTKSSPDERRVLVIGDSVVNGGAPTDQSRLATSLLQARLRGDVTPHAIVGNASAGSWGPQNELGWVKEFGLLDADVVVIVLSSHDAFDEVEAWPTTMRDEPAPYHTAIGEAIDVARARFGGAPAATPADPPPNHVGNAAPCLAALGELIDRVRAGGATPIVALHFERAELDAAAEPEGHRLIGEVCASRGVGPLSLRDAFRAAVAAGEDPYRDYIHPNEAGQRLIADALIGPVEAALRAAPATKPATATAGQ